MTSKRVGGFTLIELVVAMTIFIVIALASATLYGTIVKINLKNQVTQDVQREGDAIQAHFSQNLKSAVSVDTTNSNFVANPNTLTVKLSGGTTSRKYYVTSSQLHYIDENGTDTILVEPSTTVTSLTFATTSDANNNLKSIKISGTLSRTKNRQTGTYTIATTIDTRPQ